MQAYNLFVCFYKPRDELKEVTSQFKTHTIELLPAPCLLYWFICTFSSLSTVTNILIEGENGTNFTVFLMSQAKKEEDLWCHSLSIQGCHMNI